MSALCDGEMEPRNRDGDPFTNVAKVNVGPNMIPLRAALAACATNGNNAEPTHDVLVEHLGKVAVVATA